LVFSSRLICPTEAPISTGILVAPELPLEELFFLAFLCYLTMILITGSRRLLDRRVGQRSSSRAGRR